MTSLKLLIRYYHSKEAIHYLLSLWNLHKKTSTRMHFKNICNSREELEKKLQYFNSKKVYCPKHIQRASKPWVLMQTEYFFSWSNRVANFKESADHKYYKLNPQN